MPTWKELEVEEDDCTLPLAVRCAGGAYEVSGKPLDPNEYRNSRSLRLSSWVFGPESSVLSDVPPGPSRRLPGRSILDFLDSFLFQILSLTLVVYTLFATVSVQRHFANSPPARYDLLAWI